MGILLPSIRQIILLTVSVLLLSCVNTYADDAMIIRVKEAYVEAVKVAINKAVKGSAICNVEKNYIRMKGSASHNVRVRYQCFVNHKGKPSESVVFNSSLDFRHLATTYPSVVGLTKVTKKDFVERHSRKVNGGTHNSFMERKGFAKKSYIGTIFRRETHYTEILPKSQFNRWLGAEFHGQTKKKFYNLATDKEIKRQQLARKRVFRKPRPTPILIRVAVRQSFHNNRKVKSSRNIAMEVGSQILKRLSKLPAGAAPDEIANTDTPKPKVGACDVSTLASLKGGTANLSGAGANGMSATTRALLQKPSLADDKTFKFDYGQTVHEVDKAHKAFGLPMFAAIKKMAAKGELTFSPQDIGATIDSDRNVRPNVSIWKMYQNTHSKQKTNDRIQYSVFGSGGDISLFSLRAQIVLGAGSKFVQHEKEKYYPAEDQRFIDQKLRKAATEKWRAYQKKHAARLKKEREEARTKGMGALASGGVVYTANTDLISIGKSDQAMITWDVESRRVSLRWRQKMHILQMTAIAPNVKGAKKYGLSLANSVNAILEKHGFFKFPAGLAENLCEEAVAEKGELEEFEIVDANPSYSQDKKTLPQSLRPSQLIRAQTLRKGTTADGVSQLILRAEVSEEVGATFELLNQTDGKIEPLLGGRTVTLNKKHYAFALYTPPEIFDVENKNSGPKKEQELSPFRTLPKKRLGKILEVRDVPVSITVEGGKSVTKKFMLARPPVILVHGLFSDPVQTWISTFPKGASMAAVLERVGFLPFLVNYQNTNGMEQTKESWIGSNVKSASSSFEANKSVVWDSPLIDYKPFAYDYGFLREEPIRSELQKPKNTRIGGIKQALKYYRDDLKIAATQAIVIGHSMGGILARVWASDNYNPTYKRPENFNQGDIDRLLTLNTPHFGSELMEFKDALGKAEIKGEKWLQWTRREAVNTVVRWFLNPEPEAMRDLRPGSAALLRISKTKLPSYAISTSATSAEMGAKKNDPWKAYEAMYSFAGMVFFNNRPLLDDFVESRFLRWKNASGGKRKTQPYNGKSEKTVSEKPLLDISDQANRDEFKRIISQNIDHNVYYWAARREADYQDDLRKTLKNAIIAPYGTFSSNMGKAVQLSGNFASYMTTPQERDLLSPEVLLSKVITGTDVSRFFDERKASDIPDVFLSILRDLVFHQDPNTDGVVRVVSQAGGINETAQELIPSIVHSYSTWDYRVQRRVLFLLRQEIGSFSDQGFPSAGQLAPRYMPSSELVKPRVAGTEAITWSGMVPSHAAEFLRISDKNNVFILSRPVNSSSTQLLANCNPSLNRMKSCAAAKGMNVKGKSSSWGPQVGYIPADQRYSKLWRTVKDPAKRAQQILKYNGEVKKSTSKQHPELPDRKYAVERPLNVTSEHGDTAGICSVVTDPATKDAEQGVFLYCSEKIYRWQNGKKNGADVFNPKAALVPLSEINEARKQELLAHPMMVLADDTSTLDLGQNARGDPIRPYLTADYDLLAIGFPFEAAQCKSDGTCRPDPTPGVRQAEFDKLRGFISPRQKKLVEEMNQAVAMRAKYAGGLVTHHGPENQYPASPYVDYPVLVFDPAGDKKAVAYLIRQGPPGFRDIHLKRFFTEKNRLGYNLWPNPSSKGWQWEARRPFDLKRGYDPRDANNLPAYVDEAPRPAPNKIIDIASKQPPKADTTEKKIVVEPVKPPVMASSVSPIEKSFWSAVKNIRQEKTVRLYLERYPGGHFEKEARLLLEKITGETEKVSTSARSKAAMVCDRLAASRADIANKTAYNVGGFALRQHKAEAILACRAASIKNPDDLQSKYQWSRALRSEGNSKNASSKQERDNAALPLLEELANKKYSAAMIELARFYETGRIVKSDPEKAMRLLNGALVMGDPEAVLQLGLIYWIGDIVPRDIEKSMAFFRQKTAKGEALFRMYAGAWPADSAKGNKPRYRAFALESIRYGVGKNQIPALIAQAQIYEEGEQVPKNIAKAITLYEKAVELGYMFAKNDVARLAKIMSKQDQAAKKATMESPSSDENNGGASAVWKFVQNNNSVAVLEVFIDQYPNSIYTNLAKARLAALKSNKQSDNKKQQPQEKVALAVPVKTSAQQCDQLLGYSQPSPKGKYWLLNIPKPKFDAKEAITICRKAVEENPGIARHKMELGLAFLEDKKLDKAEKWFLKAANEGHLLAMIGLSSIYAEEGGQKSYSKALDWLRKAARGGSVQGMAFLAEAYENGNFGLAVSGVKAVQWYIKAADAGATYLYHHLAMLYELGTIVPASPREVKYWNEKGAESG